MFVSGRYLSLPMKSKPWPEQRRPTPLPPNPKHEVVYPVTTFSVKSESPWIVAPSSSICLLNWMLESLHEGDLDALAHPGVEWPRGPSEYAGVTCTGESSEPLMSSGESAALQSFESVQFSPTELFPAAVNEILHSYTQ